MQRMFVLRERIRQMDRIEIFQVLGIAATEDETEIKKAYRSRLAVTNPEDDPEGFRRLRTAYEEACCLAKKKEKVQEAADDTPSGQWLRQVSGVYGAISRRRELSEWKKLFTSDCFLSLEEEENCRRKFWVFLSKHYRLPGNVWKYLDKAMGITGHEQELRELLPGDFLRYIRIKCERGEEIDFYSFEGAEDAPYDLFLQYYDHCRQALVSGDLRKAEQNLKRADELMIHHPAMEVCRAQLLVKEGKAAEAVGILEEENKKYPEDGIVRFYLAEILWEFGKEGNTTDYQRAGEIYQSLKTENDKHYMANVRLAEWYYGQKRYKEAKKCAERALSGGAGEDFMLLLHKINAELEKPLELQWYEEGVWEAALELCWCYLQDGKISRGIRVALKIEKLITEGKRAEWYGLLSKLYIEQGEYEASVNMTRCWEAALQEKLASGDVAEEEEEKDRDRLKQAKLIRMQCLHNLGFRDQERFQEALAEAKGLVNGNSGDIGVLLEMAQIYVELQEYEQVEDIVGRLVDQYQIYAAYATRLEAGRRRLDAGAVVRDGTYCIQYFPEFAKAYEYIAKVCLDLKRWDDLDKILKKAEENKVKSAILEAYHYQKDHEPMAREKVKRELEFFRKNFRTQVAAGKTDYYEHGLPVISELLYNCPDGFMFVERGIFHRSAHHYREAQEDFEKALSINPVNPYALNGLSFVMRYQGDYEKSLYYMKKAMLYMGDEIPVTTYSDMGAIYALLGDYETALVMMEKREEREKDKNFWLEQRKAECQICLGNVEEAVRLYQKDCGLNEFRIMESTAFAWIRWGDRGRARALLRKWDCSYSVMDRVKHSLNLFGAAEPEYRRFLLIQLWVNLIAGEKQEACKFLKSLQYEDRDAKNLADGIFGAILCGEKTCGQKMAENLKRYLVRENMSIGKKYYNREKAYLRLKLLAAWYTFSEEQLEELLESESECTACDECLSPACRELEVIRILLLSRQGKTEEAGKRLQNNRKNYPWDEYTRAIEIFYSSPSGNIVL